MTIWRWIKNPLPQGLYGRAALILIVPVVAVQLVVSSVFLQRHFEDVTSQLTVALSLDLNLILDTWAREGPEAARALADALEISIEEPQFDGGTRRWFYDLSGIEVEIILRREVPALRGIDMRSNDRRLSILLDVGDGAVMSFNTERRRVSAAAPHQLLVIMLATGILMTLVAYLFLRNQLRPIRRLSAAAEAFGKGRHVPYRPAGATEVRSAGRAFLNMRDRIENHLEQRTLMLSGVSHDLRTPLTRMRLSLGMMDDSTEKDDLVRDVDDMQALLDTFLDFVRGEALDDPEPADPVAMAERIVADATRGGREVALIVPPEAEAPQQPTLVPMRPLAVQRALSNLVSNALRYGTRARVGVALHERSLNFWVEDDGPGIPEDQRADALRPFIRLDAARNQNAGSGVGLGLAIAHDIAKRHGGSLVLGDSAKMGGLRVDLTLPR